MQGGLVANETGIDYEYWERRRETPETHRRKFWHELHSSGRDVLTRFGHTRLSHDLRTIQVIAGKFKARKLEVSGGRYGPLDDSGPWQDNAIRQLEEVR